jgi:GT2 family glycosyltransferase
VTRGVTIVIPTWNGLELLERFLPSVVTAAHHYSNNSGAPTEIVVVDDASNDNTVDWLVSKGFVYRDVNNDERADAQGRQVDKLRQIAPLESGVETTSSGVARDVAKSTTFTLLKNSSNIGFGETCNRGFRAARYPLVLLLNNDVEIASDAIAPLVANFTDESIFAVHCRVFDLKSGRQCGTGKLGSFARGSIRVHRSYVLTGRDTGSLGVNPTGSLAGPLYSMFASGGSAMFDARNFLEIGGFESLLSPFYWEDVELSYRAWKRGLIVLYEPRSVARHQVSSTIGKLDRSDVHKIEQRNRLLFHWINLQDPPLLFSHLLWVCVLAVTSPLRLKFDFIPALFSAIKLLPGVRRRRIAEKRAARRTDREVFAIFDTMLGRSDLFAYDSYEELEQARGSVNR